MANYLYNGVKLPALPEWDKSTYPHAVIMLYGGVYVLSITSHPLEFGVAYGSSDSGLHAVGGGAAEIKFKWAMSIVNDDNTEWGAFNEFDETLYIGSYRDNRWTNTDIYNEDGTLYLAASDPIPVTAAPAPNMLYMLMGWLIGRAIARSRKASGGIMPEEPEETPVIETWAEQNGDVLTLYGSYQAVQDGDALEVE